MVQVAEQIEAQTEEQVETEAEYVLENSATCPKCEQSIDSLEVVRLLRAKVNFTSSLPRRGLAIVCPKCRLIISATVSTRFGL